MASLLLVFLQTQHILLSKSQSYTYLHYDRMNYLSNWQSIDNTSIVSSSNCPSKPISAFNKRFPAQIQTETPPNKICISSPNNSSSFNGQYVQQQYSDSLNFTTIYYNMKANTYIHELPINAANYQYYITNNKTIANDTIIARGSLNGRWEVLYNNTFHTDINIISIPCPNIYIDGSNHAFNNEGAFIWSHFNHTRRTNVYYCKQCIYKQYGMYLFGWIWNNYYLWAIGPYFNKGYAVSACTLGYDFSEDYTFDINDCANGSWQTAGILSDDLWFSDIDMRISNERTISMLPDTKICVHVNGSHNSSYSYLDGEYEWLYYDSDLNSSVYYNIHENLFLYPFISSDNEYQYHISNNIDVNASVVAYCTINTTISDVYIFSINDCIGKWNVDLIATPCQDLCVDGSEVSFFDGATFVYSHFNATRGTNIYYCEECVNGDINGYYLYSLIDERDEYAWHIGYDYNEASAWSFCYLNENLTNSYIFKIDHCLKSDSWVSWFLWGSNSDWSYDSNMKVSKCNSEESLAKEMCVKLDSKLYQTYSIDDSYRNFAIGIDVNMTLNENEIFVINYNCDIDTEISELMELVIFNETLMVADILYLLPSECDNSSTISIKFSVESIDTVNYNALQVYIDNVYLYYNVGDIIFYDDIENDKSVKTSNCTSAADDYCYVLWSYATTLNYSYKDLNFEWLLNTNGLHNSTIFTVEVECDNYLCILKQYNFAHECMNGFCNIESYNLPHECDFSSQIRIGFSLQSSSMPTDMSHMTYIDYVQLTHSNPFGQTSVCITSQPTLSPTSPIASTLALDSSDGEDLMNSFAFSTLHLILIVCGSILCICVTLLILVSILKRLYKLEQAQNNDYIMKNAMVILLAVGIYDQEPNDADQELKHVYLSDLDAVDLDIKNLCRLFSCNNLNYTVYPNYNSSSNINIYWTQEQIISLLTEKAVLLERNLHIFDGLIVAISGHGWNDNICTSDYKMIDKTSVHRIFSQNHPLSREIPRIFLFDCCDGDNEHGKRIRKRTEQPSKTEDVEEKCKSFTVDDIKKTESMVIWDYNTKNPDHRLVEINAANRGFQSKINTEIGSYMLYEFVNKTIDDLQNNKNQYIHQIFDDIQNDLQDRNKQLIKNTYNNNTRYVKLKANTNNNTILPATKDTVDGDGDREGNGDLEMTQNDNDEIDDDIQSELEKVTKTSTIGKIIM